MEEQGHTSSSTIAYFQLSLAICYRVFSGLIPQQFHYISETQEERALEAILKLTLGLSAVPAALGKPHHELITRREKAIYP